MSGAYALWFEQKGIEAKVVGVEAESKKSDLLTVEVAVAADAAIGSHSLRVITPGGLSDSLALHVHPQAAVVEADGAHDTARQAQKTGSLPAAIHGRIAEIGEVDYYSFQVEAGDEWHFRTRSSPALDPGIGIYELRGSWFDPDRDVRLAFHDEDVVYPDLPSDAHLTYRFDKAGEYFVRVNGFWGYGGADYSYVLLISRTPSQVEEAAPAPDWTERTWTRKLETDRMKQLWGRAANPPSALGDIPVLDADAEPTKLPVEPPEIALPTLIVGTIEHPGDVDRAQFSVKEGDRLVFEIETPEATVPMMNPLLRIFDSDGNEALTNVHSRINANNNITKQIRSKVVYSFPRGGDFRLEISDVTANYGGRDMRYRVLARPQVPHLGEVHVDVDRLNLVAGEAGKLNVVTDQEEGFEGFAVLSIEDLPEGVRAVTATEVEPDSPPPFNEGKIERFAAKNQKATFVLLSDPDAPATRFPVRARVLAQPVVGGKLGTPLLAKDLWVMVLPAQKLSEESTQSTESR